MGRDVIRRCDVDDLQLHASERLRGRRYRHTSASRSIVEALAASAAPMTIAELIETCALPTSSAYRGLRRLWAVGMVHEVPHIGAARYELSHLRRGDLRHNALCRQCGDSVVIPASPRLRAVLAEGVEHLTDAGVLSECDGLTVVGVCTSCAAG